MYLVKNLAEIGICNCHFFQSTYVTVKEQYREISLITLVVYSRSTRILHILPDNKYNNKHSSSLYVRCINIKS